MRRASILLCIAMALLMPAPAVPEEHALAIVVHPKRTAALDIEDVAHIFLRKRRFWEDGAPIVALNREPGTAARAAFSRRVLRADPAQLEEYWNHKYFDGVFPPTVLSSCTAVKRYVATDRNAIGYIDLSEVDDSVRVVLKLE
ncbi:MAG: phosphate ABC transporter substrate-binding protein [Deltaproteobacteria bacterium]|nr:MAG: phosphate ABC transporter substrate-binding protein [Deltaproteobacteria bacterium]